MISLAILCIGIFPSAIAGWLLLRAAEGHAPVLLQKERWAMAIILGPTMAMFLAFFGNVTVGLPFTRLGFFLAHAVLLSIAALAWFFRVYRHSLPVPHVVPLPHSSTSPLWFRITMGILIVWTAAKFIIAGTTFLLLTPNFLDDTLDNWNLRGKVFYHEQTFTLNLPRDPNPQVGVSSYPPTVPLLKTWLSTIRGSWQEDVANSIHFLWYPATLILVASTLRRRLPRAWGHIGTYILASLPLYLLHGTNAYADAFLAAHVTAAVLPFLDALFIKDSAHRKSFIRVGALTLAILPFTKNEATMLYAAPLFFMVLGTCWLLRKHTKGILTTLMWWYGGALLLLSVPWIIYKWMNGLAFGNAKAISGLQLEWHDDVFRSIFINTYFEGSWLLLFALGFATLMWRWKKAILSPLLFLTTFILLIYIGQIAIFVLTPLAYEALRQTGYARGLLHIVPLFVTLFVLLLADGVRPYAPAWLKEEQSL